MSSVTRQYNLLVAEDWKKIYQTFKDANFQSYDFETIRKSMIDYLRLYYPEDFNDFIESSEFIALIDLISFLGQSLAFRADLNTRENFLDTAERRDSILKLARLISYNPKRSIPASGFLKIESLSSTETLYDSTGLNLSNIVISWNDITNDNWLEHFNIVLNSALINSQVIGKSGNTQVINDISTSEYTINTSATSLPVYPFSASVEGTSTTFEVVSASSVNKSYVYEIAPQPTQFFNFLYRNDNNGNDSINTGFFLYFKQGELKSTTFTLNESLPNRVVNINYPSINNTDTWLYSLNASGTVDEPWTLVPAVTGVNVVYNKLAERNIYQVNTKVNDQVELVFGDGSFSNIPQGNFAFYYRVSNGQSYKITPEEMQGVTININYTSRSGRAETLTLRASLNYTVTNAVGRESAESIRQKAPQQYYTQNRMITGEDYNIFPYTSFSNVIKAKAVNRTSSGISRYLDVNDPTGKYSSTNIFSDDGVLYKEDTTNKFEFLFNNSADITKLVYNDVLSKIRSQELVHFYYSHFTRFSLPGVQWNIATTVTNGCTGSFRDLLSGQLKQVGHVTASNAKYIRVGSIVKFVPPPGKYFNSHNFLIDGTPQFAGDKKQLYVSVTQVIGDGTADGSGVFVDGAGPVMLNQHVPTGAVVEKIIPVFKNDLSNDIITMVINGMLSYESFGLSYNPKSQGWFIISKENINYGDFPDVAEGSEDIPHQGDQSGLGLDSSWLLYFTFDGKRYTIGYRGLNYFFESYNNVKFYFDDKVKIYDPKTGTTVHDQIKVLKVNSKPSSTDPLNVDYVWYVHKNIVEEDGYENNNKILLTFPDKNNDGIPDNPDLFSLIVEDSSTVFFKEEPSYDSFSSITPLPPEAVITVYTSLVDIEANKDLFVEGTVFYAANETSSKFYTITNNNGTKEVNEVSSYSYKHGRSGIYFQYQHHSPSYRRIDPSPNNIIDLYVLTRSLDTSYRQWIRDSSGKSAKPVMPSSEELRIEFNSLENYKAISDTLIFNSAKFKPLFGNKADPVLQATFKVVKNPSINVSDNDIKSGVVSAINNYFNVNNWEFGETFFFSELSAYLHSALSPNVSSIILVPKDTSVPFGNLYQINAGPDEILVSAATVDDVEVISSITSTQINQNLLY